MKNLCKLCVLQIMLAAICSLNLHAQTRQVTASSGGDFEGQNYQLSFTLGECATKTCCNHTMMLTQGFHQPMLYVTEVNELSGLDYKIKAYPNPATELVNLSVNKELPTGSSYLLFDIHGGIIQKEQIEGLTTEVPFDQLIPASYFLQIVHQDKTLKTFKIIKK